MNHEITGEKEDRLESIAREVLQLARSSLTVNLRFMDEALGMLKMKPCTAADMACDGKYFFYYPRYILRCYREDRYSTAHDYLHSVFHCIFGHMFCSAALNRDYWDIACDIAVEYAISGLELQTLSKKGAEQQQPVFRGLEDAGIMLTAEKLYAYFCEKNLEPETLEEYRRLFFADFHSVWYMHPEEKSELYGIAGSVEDEEEPDAEESILRSMDELRESHAAEPEKVWRDISRRILMDLEHFSKTRGSGGGALVQNLREFNREKYDYSSFLKKFAVAGEAMKINDDEFDYIYYTYGLKLYKKLPLVEPLEYRDIMSIREFVIVIDTSASTSGTLVQKFVEKTYNILLSTESFFRRINLHIIQCDEQIQQDIKISNRDELERYMKELKIYGLGGTDYRPAFRYVDSLIEQGEFSNLKGLIYFTDGWGIFPKKKPAYSTAFVFIDDDYRNPDVPPWAIKLVLQRNEI